MQIWHIWVIIGFAFLIWEIFTPGFFVASLGVGAFFAAIISHLGGLPTSQVIALTVGTLITFLFVRPILCLLYKSKGDERQTGTFALVGQSTLVIEMIENDMNKGRVKIGGEEWKARSLNGDDIHEGELVIIDKIEGVTAFVKQKEI